MDDQGSALSGLAGASRGPRGDTIDGAGLACRLLEEMAGLAHPGQGRPGGVAKPARGGHESREGCAFGTLQQAEDEGLLRRPRRRTGIG